MKYIHVVYGEDNLDFKYVEKVAEDLDLYSAIEYKLNNGMKFMARAVLPMELDEMYYHLNQINNHIIQQGKAGNWVSHVYDKVVDDTRLQVSVGVYYGNGMQADVFSVTKV